MTQTICVTVSVFRLNGQGDKSFFFKKDQCTCLWCVRQSKYNATVFFVSNKYSPHNLYLCLFGGKIYHLIVKARNTHTKKGTQPWTWRFSNSTRTLFLIAWSKMETLPQRHRFKWSMQNKASADRNMQVKWTQLYRGNGSRLVQKCGLGVWGEFPCYVSVA